MDEEVFAYFDDPRRIEINKELRNKYAEYRSNVLDTAIEIETLLVATLSHFLVGQDYVRFSLLRYLIFDAEFCNFMQLRKMLSTVFHLCGDQINCMSKTEADRLRSNIDKIIKIRNMFAHGMLIPDLDTGEIKVRHYESKVVLQTITDASVKRYIEMCKSTLKSLSVLNEFFRENMLCVDCLIMGEERNKDLF